MQPRTYQSGARVGRSFFALLRRDMRVARKELAFFLVRTTMQPLLFLVVFGYLLPKMSFRRQGISDRAAAREFSP